MTRFFLALLSGALALPLAVSPLVAPAPARAGPAPERISGPYTAQNLSIYFLHGPSRPGPVPLTLAEAIKSGAATVFETGTVNRLSIQNTGDREVFVQAGDIVKGGRQDRVLSVSLLIPPRSARIPIGAYCVEQGRWRKRGAESAAKFQSAASVLPSKAAKLAMLAAPPAANVAESPDTRPDPAIVQQRQGTTRSILGNRQTALRQAEPTRQQRVWASVGAMQDKLSRNVNTAVRSGTSASSLQLSLENKKVAEAREKLIAALKDKAGSANDIVGYVFAVNGRINSGDIYPSNALFRKMWPRLIEASATEAIAEKDAKDKKPTPAIQDVTAFLRAAEDGKPKTEKLNVRLTREYREAKGKAVLMSTRRNDGSYVHRSFVAY